MSKYRVFSGLYFPACGLNKEIYGINTYSVGIMENADQKKLLIWTLHPVKVNVVTLLNMSNIT